MINLTLDSDWPSLTTSSRSSNKKELNMLSNN